MALSTTACFYTTLGDITKSFDSWLKERRKRDVRRVALTDLTACLDELAGRLAPATVYGHPIEVRNFFAYLKTMGYLLTDPMEDLDAKAYQRKDNKRGVFTLGEIASFLDALGVTDNLALRTFFELLCSSALRLSEGLNLTLVDLDLRERTLLVRDGKGGKDRYVPFSQTALLFL